MLPPEQFDSDRELPTFPISVANLKICGSDLGRVEIPVSYDASGSPVFHLKNFVDFRQALSPDFTASIQSHGLKANIELLPIHREYSSDTGSVTVNAVATSVPVLLGSSDAACRIEAVLLHPPKFLQYPILLIDEKARNFRLSPFRTKNHTAWLLTSDIQVDAETSLEPFLSLINFLTFVKGSNCGLGNLVAFNSDGIEAFRVRTH